MADKSKVEVHELGMGAIPDQLRKDLIVQVRPVRLTVISKIMDGVRSLTQFDADMIRALRDAEKEAPVPDTMSEEEKEIHAQMLTSLDAVLDVQPRLKQWEAGMLAAMEKYTPPEDADEAGKCTCPLCVAKRAAAKATEGTRVPVGTERTDD